jgi:hypothetical protein
VLLCAALASGPVALIRGSAAAPPARTVPAAVPLASSDPTQVVAGEAAIAWVTTWLTTDRTHAERIRSWYVGAQPLLPAAAAHVDRPSVASVQPGGGGTWSVVVALDVAEAPAQSSPAANTAPAAEVDPPVSPSPSSAAALTMQRRYFQVAMFVAPSQQQQPGYLAPRVQALTLPAPVAGPVAASDARLDYREGVSPTSYLGATVRTFLQALLAGQGDVTRVVSPRSVVVPVVPAVATDVRLTGLSLLDGASESSADRPNRDGDSVRVLADAALLLPAGDTRTSQYALTLSGRGGRWEVSSIDLAPAVRAAYPVTSQAPPNTPTPAPTGTP